MLARAGESPAPPEPPIHIVRSRGRDSHENPFRANALYELVAQVGQAIRLPVQACSNTAGDCHISSPTMSTSSSRGGSADLSLPTGKGQPIQRLATPS